MKITAIREHYFDAGHRVYNHESKCAVPHGHGYRVAIHCEAPEGGLDELGRVIDFGVIKERVCTWIDDNLDHRFLCWAEDPLANALEAATPGAVYRMSYNPTAENIGRMLLMEATRRLAGTGVNVIKVVVHETVKCRAEVEL